MRVFATLCTAALILLTAVAFSGTTGKIVGTVKDAQTGEPLPSVNVVIEGTTFGAATNPDGYFTILNVPSGRYRVVANLVGYKQATVVNVRVDIDQTTDLNVRMSEEAISGEEVTVVATRPVVQKDVAASRANIEIAEVERLPVTTVSAAIGLQAGVQAGLSIRGGTASETAFMVNGNVMRDERTNQPYSSISLLAVQDIQVQTGGFSAEYGNVRSGIVNVITREGNKSAYNVGFMARASNTAPKHFGASIYDKNSYWVRPYLESPIAWKGTQAIDPATNQPYWDEWTRKQYPAFEGWNSIAAKNIGTANELSPEALQRLFLWQRRKIAEINDADYDIDFSLGGPVPVISEQAGNLRFFGSFHKTQKMYLVPLSDNAWRDYSGNLKFTSDVSGGMKLTVEGMLGRTTGTNNNNSGNPGMFQTPEDIGAVLNQVSYIDTRIFATDYWAPTSTDYYSVSAKLSHALDAQSYYDASISMFRSSYSTNPGRGRDTSKIYKFGNTFYADESPFGFDSLPNPASGLADIRFGIGFSNSRDTSKVASYTARFDYTNQFDKFNQVKAGVEFIYTDQDIHYGLYDAKLKDNVFANGYNRFPIKGAVYLRDKLEFEGMVADLGVRMDYLNPQGTWYSYTAYTDAFSGNGSAGIDTLLVKEPVEKQVLLSPRIGISFPISENAKLFFNYGHFFQQPSVDNMFLLRQSSFDKSYVRVADPNAPLPRTVAYELGYEHSLAEEYLIRVAAYYKDISSEPLLVGYTNRKSTVDYSEYTSNAYRDIRGFELSFYKNRGNWIQGFVNYTYDVRTNGYYGVSENFQNPIDQQKYELANPARLAQQRPIPRPYARANVHFFTARDFGPEMGGLRLLGDWQIDLIGNWSSGYYLTWTGGSSIPGVQDNVQWSDYWNVDMRITKSFQFGKLSAQLFADFSNLLNYKYMTTYGCVTSADYTSYMQSLHLPAFSPEVDNQVGYVNVAGSDHPGNYRKEGVAFQPIVSYRTLASLQQLTTPQARPFYYAADVNQYYQYVNNAWQPVEAGRLQQVLDDKAYIDMPNMDTFTFLNPRRIFFGVRLSFEI